VFNTQLAFSELFVKMRYSIAAASLFSTSALAVLYPGQSNLNHTCQISEYWV